MILSRFLWLCLMRFLMFKFGWKDFVWGWHMFRTMLRVDFEQARGTFSAKLVDRFIWVMSLILVAAYLLPSMGISSEYGKILLAGALAGLGIIESYSSIALIVADLSGDYVLSYYLTLPVSATLIFMRMLVYNALFFSVACFLLFPLCNIWLPEPIAYGSIHWPKFVAMLLLTNFFHGAVILWGATFVQDMRMLGKVWSRILHPLWFFGGFQFTWATAAKKSPFLGYLVLLNPLMHATDGLRSAVLQDGDYLPFWVMATFLFLATVFATWHGITRFKRRLDLV